VISNPVPTSPQTVQYSFMESLRQQRTPVWLYLLSGVRLQGEIHAFDQYTVSIANPAIHVVFKSAIATILPASAVAQQPAAPPSAAQPSEVRRPEGTHPRPVTITRRRPKLSR
jgi:host factor-I protein